MTVQNSWFTQALSSKPYHEKIERILRASIAAVDPAWAVCRHVFTDGHHLHFGDHRIIVNDLTRVVVLGLGKASPAMAVGLQRALPAIQLKGVIVSKQTHPDLIDLLPNFQFIIGGHPIPDLRSIQAGQQLLSAVTGLSPQDIVICLISGGGSSLACVPPAEINLDNIQTLTQLLLESGASIQEINTLRKHLDEIKGGGLARAAFPARGISFVLSDVVGNSIDMVASGPTAPDPTTFLDALEILNRYGLYARIPPEIRTHLDRGGRGEIPETLKPGDLMENFFHIIIGSNSIAANSARHQAEKEGFYSEVISTELTGEAHLLGHQIGLAAQEWTKKHPHLPTCLIWGGESTVTVRGNGSGGRNQELALGAVPVLAGSQAVMVTMATDGEDGITPAAGAVVNGTTLERGQQIGMDSIDYLARNDSHSYFSALGDTLTPGSTGTNVNDLTFLFLFPED